MTCNENKKVLIIGGGPVGLAACLFLVEKGCKPRIIEKLTSPTQYSKALGVNARSLELLESVGATELFLNNGSKINAANIYKNNNFIVKNSLADPQYKYPFVLMQKQSESEKIFSDLLEKHGILVERGVELVDLKNIDNGVRVDLKHQDSTLETAQFDMVFAADGAHSTSRKLLNLSFDGSGYEEPWLLCDVELTTNLNPNEIHGFFFSDSFVLLAPIRDNTWRLAGNSSDYLEKLPEGTKIENILWKSEFHISHRIIERFNVGNVYFGGDAGHIHSPVGGRGMNLGIEDAYVFAKLFCENKLPEYHDQRYKVASSLVKKIEYISDFVRGKSLTSRFFQMVAPYILPTIAPYVLGPFQRYILGLDHITENVE